jgi:hypothetical protein
VSSSSLIDSLFVVGQADEDASPAGPSQAELPSTHVILVEEFKQLKKNYDHVRNQFHALDILKPEEKNPSHDDETLRGQCQDLKERMYKVVQDRHVGLVYRMQDQSGEVSDQAFEGVIQFKKKFLNSVQNCYFLSST